MGLNTAVSWILYGAESADAAIVVHAPDTRILWSNAKAAQLLGIGMDRLSGMVASDPSFTLIGAEGSLLSLDEYPVVKALRDQARVEDQIVGVRRADGSETWGRVTAVPQLEEGELVAVVVTFVDITELRATQRDLERSQERLSLAIAGSQDALWIVDVQSRELWFSPRFETMMGLEPGRVQPNVKAWLDRVHPDDVPRLLEVIGAHLDSGDDFDIRYRLRHRAGHWVHVQARAKALRDASGRVRLAGTLTDISDRVRAEEDQRREDARIEATARLESLAVLAGGIAHDFNNLLVGILGAADLAQTVTDEPGAVERHLDTIARSAEQAAALTRQLMAYAGRAPTVLEVVELAKLEADLCRIVRGGLGQRAEFATDLAADTPVVEVDATQLRQVVLNLLVNATQSAPDGRVRIAVSTTRAQCSRGDLQAKHSAFGEPGLYGVVIVEDDGVGMDEATLLRAFEPYFTTKASGHGLGLAAVRGLIRTHRGFVDVRTAPGQGTRMEVGLPVSTSRARTGSGMPAAQDRPGESRLILLVEDQELVRRVVVRMLEAEGFRVVWREDGQRLLHLLAELQPELLILDVTLPGESGLTLHERLREDGHTLPVLLCSGHIDVPEQLVIDGDSATSFLAKPFRRDDLVAAITELTHAD